MRLGTLLLVLVALAGGFVAGWMAGTGDGGGGSSTEDLPEVRAPAATTPPPRLEAQGSAKATADEEPTQDQVDALRRAVEALPIPPVPRGDGEITGAVRTEDGTPVPGVLISAAPTTAPFTRIERDLPEAEEAAAHMRALRWRRAALLSATSGADGTYRLTGLGDGRYHVAAGRLPGFTFQPADRRAGEAVAGDRRDFVATPGVEVTVHLVLPNGRAVNQGTVAFEGDAGPRGYVWSATSTQPLTVAPGRYRVTAQSTQDGFYRSEPQEVALELGVAAELRLTLLARPVLEVSLLVPEGEDLGQRQVLLAPLPEGVEPDVALLRASEQTNFVAPGGVARFQDLVPGRYMVGTARSWQGPIVAMRVVEVRDASVRTELEIPPLERREYIVAQVTGPDDAPVDGVDISASYKGPRTSSGMGKVMSTRRRDGSYWILHPPHGAPSDDGGSWWLHFRHRRLGTRSASYVPGTASEVRVRFQEPARLTVHVEGVEARYQGRLGVQVVPTGVDAMPALGPTSIPLPRDGRLDLPGQQPGPYLVQLTLNQPHSGPASLLDHELQLPPQGTTVRLRCPVLHAVRMRGAAGQVNLSRTGHDGWHRWQMIAVSGEDAVAFDGLPEGEYTARSGAQSATFRVPTDTEVVLR